MTTVAGCFTADDSHALGREAGKSHANYVNAYGGPDLPDVIDVPGQRAEHADAYRAGFAEGVETIMSADVYEWHDDV